MEKRKKDGIEINELFMAQADHERCFYGIIKRDQDENGNSFVFSRIIVNDGLICSRAPEEKELGWKLDELCKMVLDGRLHKDSGVFTMIFGEKRFLN